MIPVPTVRAAAVAVVLVVAVALFPPGAGAGLVFVNLLLAGVLVVDWALAVPPDRLRIERLAPGAVREGARAELRWQVSNGTARTADVAIGDDLPPSLRVSPPRSRAVVPAAMVATTGATIRPRRRGRFELRGLAVRSFGPLGLVGRQRFVDLPGVIRVQPEFPSERDAVVRAARLRMIEAGVRPVRVAAGSREFDALREYTPDDEFRRIDWAATARTNRPIVRTYRSERNQLLVILVDAGRLMAGSVGGVSRLDHAIDAAMALTAVATSIGDRIGLVAFDHRVRRVVPSSGSRRQLARITEALYDLDAELVESDYRGAIVETLARFPRRALLVLLTELPSTAASELLAGAVPRVARHHLPVVASVRDPQLETWAHGDPAKASDAYRAAAAAAALDDRGRLASQIRARGATVVDAAPGRLAPSLVDVYLRVKTTGRL